MSTTGTSKTRDNGPVTCIKKGTSLQLSTPARRRVSTDGRTAPQPMTLPSQPKTASSSSPRWQSSWAKNFSTLAMRSATNLHNVRNDTQRALQVDTADEVHDGWSTSSAFISNLAVDRISSINSCSSSSLDMTSGSRKVSLCDMMRD